MSEHQLPLANQLVFNQFEHLLVGSAALPHLVLILVQEHPDFFVDAVFEVHLGIHYLENLLGQIESFRDFDHFLFYEFLDDLLGEELYKISSKRHGKLLSYQIPAWAGTVYNPYMQTNGLRHDWTPNEVQNIYNSPLIDAVFAAQTAHRRYFEPSEVQLYQ